MVRIRALSADGVQNSVPVTEKALLLVPFIHCCTLQVEVLQEGWGTTFDTMDPAAYGALQETWTGLLNYGSPGQLINTITAFPVCFDQEVGDNSLNQLWMPDCPQKVVPLNANCSKLSKRLFWHKWSISPGVKSGHRKQGQYRPSSSISLVSPIHSHRNVWFLKAVQRLFVEECQRTLLFLTRLLRE